MNLKIIVRVVVILAIMIFSVGCDQISKKLVRNNINFREEIVLIDNHLTLTNVENSGAFLSTGASWPQPFKTVLLIFLPLSALLFGLLYVIINRRLSNSSIAAICFIVGGGIGNLYDRIVHGSVTDFLHIDFVFFQTGIFNIADVSILTGMILLLWDLLTTRHKGIAPN